MTDVVRRRRAIFLVSGAAMFALVLPVFLTWVSPSERWVRDQSSDLTVTESMVRAGFAPQSERSLDGVLASARDSLALAAARAGRVARVYAHYPFESHSSDLIWEIGAFALALLGLAFRLYTLGITSGGSRLSPDGHLDTSGPYSIVRHPLYLANLVVGMGLSLFPHGWVLPVVVMATGVVYCRRRIRRDEDLLRAQFGTEFERWAREVPAILPRVSRYIRTERRFDWRMIRHGEYSRGALFLLVPILLDALEDYVESTTIVMDPVWTVVAISGMTVLVGVEAADLRWAPPSRIGDGWRTRYFTEFRESKALAVAILTDIQGFLEGINSRRSLEHIQDQIRALRDFAHAGQRATAAHILQVSTRCGDSRVYRSHAGHISVLGPLAAPVASLYTRLTALEQMQAIQEEQKLLLDRRNVTLDPNTLIIVYEQILEFTHQAVSQAERLVPQLRAFANRRLWGIFP